MGLAETQAALARLYTDAPLRERFLSGPEAVATELNLDRRTARALAERAEEIRYFARSLLQKRLSEAAPLLPLTCAALAEQCEPCFLRYAASASPTGTNKPLEDALAFSLFLRHASGAPAWAADLAAYEATCIALRRGDRRWAIQCYGHPIRRLANTVAAGRLPGAVPRRPCVAIWLPGWSGGRPLHFSTP